MAIFQETIIFTILFSLIGWIMMFHCSSSGSSEPVFMGNFLKVGYK